VRDLNTLAPETWLNDNVVNLTTQVLASRAITESRRAVAVFDSQFTEVSPKHRLIVALDSLKVGSVTDARIISRWMYDETKYNHPADAEKMFQPYQQDLGWKYMVDKELAVQGDSYNCGVLMVGYFHCLLFRMNPRQWQSTANAFWGYARRKSSGLHTVTVD
jgi:hypothetical protein